MWPAIAAMVAMSALKARGDQKKEAQSRKEAAATMRYSPWTNMQAGPIQQADPMGTMMQGGVSGAMLGQNMANQERMDKHMDAMDNYYNNAAATNTAAAGQPTGGMGIPMMNAPEYTGARSSAWNYLR